MPHGAGCGRRWLAAMVLPLMLLLLSSATGCARRYVVIEGEETISVRKGTLDALYGDNEDLLRALQECRAREGAWSK